METISQAELEKKVLELFFNEAQKNAGQISQEDVAVRLNSEFGQQRINLAIRSLSDRGLVEGEYDPGFGVLYAISDKGYKQAELTYFERLEAVEASQAQSDPVREMERQLAPAAGRMVSFGDNQAALDQAVLSVEQAENILNASNMLDPELRDESIASLTAWSSLIKATKSFAVGAFRYLVWDRLKKICESAIEDTYRFAITGLLLALGTLVLGLL